MAGRGRPEFLTFFSVCLICVLLYVVRSAGAEQGPHLIAWASCARYVAWACRCVLLCSPHGQVCLSSIAFTSASVPVVRFSMNPTLCEGRALRGVWAAAAVPVQHRAGAGQLVCSP